MESPTYSAHQEPTNLYFFFLPKNLFFSSVMNWGYPHDETETSIELCIHHLAWRNLSEGPTGETLACLVNGELFSLTVVNLAWCSNWTSQLYSGNQIWQLEIHSKCRYYCHVWLPGGYFALLNVHNRFPQSKSDPLEDSIVGSARQRVAHVELICWASFALWTSLGLGKGTLISGDVLPLMEDFIGCYQNTI